MEIELLEILTATWFADISEDMIRVGVSRGSPRGMKAGYRRCSELAPGPWFKTAEAPEYLKRFNDQLGQLDPGLIRDKLIKLGNGKAPVLCCYEPAADIQAGKLFCHRHMVAQWLEDKLGIVVKEHGHPELDRFAHFKQQDLTVPSYGS